MHVLQDPEFQWRLDSQLGTVCGMLAWFCAFELEVCRELPVWDVCFAPGQSDLYSLRLLLSYLRWILNVLFNVRIQSTGIERELCFNLPLWHIFLVWILLDLSSRLCQLLRWFLQPMLELSSQSPCAIQWPLSFDLQENTTSTVLPGLGVCLSQLINSPVPSGTTPAPFPTITGIDAPTPHSKRTLEWWQILLMALGCAFIFLVIIWLCRRRARKQRATKTLLFATTPGYHRTQNSGWRWWLFRFGEKLFGHNRSRKAMVAVPPESEAMKLTKLRQAEEARGEEYDMVKLIGEYQYPDRSLSPAEPSRHYNTYNTCNDRLVREDRQSIESAPSMYSQMTGVPRKAPEPRQPLRKKELTSRFSSSTYSSDEHLQVPPGGGSSKNPFWK
ncbi:hypothetical protein DXG03_002379 [Asterophora parasitica]|uniref:Uncharacterized protein n=1 Tax=Asterophora parasitica TaxID=117018 RepID=A0A9P7G8E8_9AGAR|nr:hypothetical protein DXG03_002379 [Asterophora parasitica]